MNISSLEYKGQQIDLTFENGFLACTFEINGDSYGTKTQLSTHDTLEIASAAALLFINAIESIEKIKNT